MSNTALKVEFYLPWYGSMLMHGMIYALHMGIPLPVHGMVNLIAKTVRTRVV